MTMTVNELIHALKNLSPDLPVVIEDFRNGNQVGLAKVYGCTSGILAILQFDSDDRSLKAQKLISTWVG